MGMRGEYLVTAPTASEEMGSAQRLRLGLAQMTAAAAAAARVGKN